MSALLAVRRLQKRHGARLLLDIDEVQFQPASAYVLTGENGAGKSTLLRILSGLDRADRAEASFAGQTLPLTPYPRLLRDAIVYVHQHPVLFAGSVADNVGYGLRVRGTAAAEIARRVDAALDWAGITHLRNNPADTLSGGEKQRVALARANILAPRLLLLDEPTSNLDGAAREQVIALIPTLISQGRSVVLACHDRDLIALPQVQRLKLRDGHLTSR